MKTKAAFVAVVLGLASQLSHGAGCVVENDEIAVIGKLSRETFAGPPNYQSVDRGDKAETHWILTVREPIVLCTLVSADGKPHTIGSLGRFQLVLNEEQGGLTRALIARHAWVRGRVSMGHSGPQHMAALIEVTELGPATQSPFGLR
jgi:hypothetical protein